MSVLIKPRFYQQEAIDATLNVLQTDKDAVPLIGMPTGSGKSPVISILCANLLRSFPKMRIVVSTHSKELVAQNAETMKKTWPDAPYGIFSAGIGLKQSYMPITFCGIQSAAKCPEKFGVVHLLIIDEAHIVGPDEESNYQKFIAGLRLKNPGLRVVGLTATPYRRKTGMLYDGPLFNKMSYDITGLHAFIKLVEWGFLSPLTAKPTSFEFDVSNIKMTGGDYNAKALEEAVNKEELTLRALQEARVVLSDRKKIMVFCVDVAHVESTYATLLSLQEKATFVHSRMKEGRDDNIKSYLFGDSRWIVNAGVLTTGFDSPATDGIVLLRPTTSVVLHVQILGRGTRPVYAPGFDLETESGRIAAIAAGSKPHGCRVLDFAGNISRLGPINDPKIPKKKKKGEPGDLPIKICPSCGEYNHAAARVCTDCGHIFPFETKIEQTASTAEPMAKKKTTKDKEAEAHWFHVDHVEYSPIRRVGKPDAFKINYRCGVLRYSEYVGIEDEGFAGKKARDIFRERHVHSFVPETTEDALELVDELIQPKWIFVHTNAQWPQVLKASFEDECPKVERPNVDINKYAPLDKEQTNG